MNTINHILGRRSTILAIAIVATVSLVGCMTGDVYRQERAALPANAQYRDYNIEDLNQYGEWVSISQFGRVWRPLVTEGWRPFFHGHWAYANDQWTWLSYEPFGWITYHYGEWYLTPDYGWVWIPEDGAWSPAQVQWIVYDDFVCWAPLAPGGIIWPHPWEARNASVWTTVRIGDFTQDNVGGHEVARVEPLGEGVDHQAVGHSPQVKMIEERTGQKVQSVNIGREPVSAGKGQVHKMNLPESETQRVEKYRPGVEREVLRSRNQGEHR